MKQITVIMLFMQVSICVCTSNPGPNTPLCRVEDSMQEQKHDRRVKLDTEEARSIDLYTANMFHKWLTRTTRKVNPALRVYYEGPLARPGGEPGASSDSLVDWNIVEGREGENFLICDIVVSTRAGDDVITNCIVKGKTLFIAIRDLDAKKVQYNVPVVALGGKSVREFVAGLGK